VRVVCAGPHRGSAILSRPVEVEERVRERQDPGASPSERRCFPPPDERLDTVGLFCPIPIIKTAARMRGMKPGDVLEILSDDRVILVDLPNWCKSTGHAFLGYHEQSREMHLFVRKG